MKTIQLIQFTNHTHEDHGMTPTLYQWYRVLDLTDDYEVVQEDDDGDEQYSYLDAIRISLGMRTNLTGRTYERTEKIIKDDDTEYNLITLEVDEASNLFDIGGN